jgi:nicotinamide-nucleotide amidase
VASRSSALPDLSSTERCPCEAIRLRSTVGVGVKRMSVHGDGVVVLRDGERLSLSCVGELCLSRTRRRTGERRTRRLVKRLAGGVMQPTGYKEHMTDPQDQIADALSRSGRTAAAAESLTGGNISAALSAIEGASNWFLGGVVAYAETVKFDLLGVHRGPVVNAPAAQQMVTGVAELLGADFAVATTGVGGPGPQEDQPPGTVYIAVASPAGCQVRRYGFDGDPPKVVEQTTLRALQDLADAIASS